MICITTTNELMAYMDDLAEPRVVRHIKRCSRCQRKVQELKRAQKRFRAKLFGHSCPSAMELGEYHLGTLSARQGKRIRTHLRRCRTCSQQLNELQDFVDDPSLHSLSPSDSPPRILYPHPSIAAAKYGYATTSGYRVRGSGNRPTNHKRGQGENETFTYNLNDSEINIQIQNSDSKLGHKTIWGLMVGPEMDTIHSAQLKPLNPSLPSMTQDVEAGLFTIEHVPPGEYELLLIANDSTVLLRDLNV